MRLPGRILVCAIVAFPWVALPLRAQQPYVAVGDPMIAALLDVTRELETWARRKRQVLRAPREGTLTDEEKKAWDALKEATKKGYEEPADRSRRFRRVTQCIAPLRIPDPSHPSGFQHMRPVRSGGCRFVNKITITSPANASDSPALEFDTTGLCWQVRLVAPTSNGRRTVFLKRFEITYWTQGQPAVIRRDMNKWLRKGRHHLEPLPCFADRVLVRVWAEARPRDVNRCAFQVEVNNPSWDDAPTNPNYALLCDLKRLRGLVSWYSNLERAVEMANDIRVRLGVLTPAPPPAHRPPHPPHPRPPAARHPRGEPSSGHGYKITVKDGEVTFEGH